MNPALLAPFVVGGLAVVQAGLNRQVGARLGLATATLINAGVFVVCGLVLLGVARVRPEWLPAGFAPRSGEVPWWIVVPGICGFGLVMTMPWAVARLGAQRAFVTLVVGQVLAAIAWDYAVDGQLPRPARLAGTALAVLGVAIASYAK